ncbi:MAG: hypothetical protein RLZ10_2078 [Bacteroidota bacterium]|jgi:hypothetical protein
MNPHLELLRKHSNYPTLRFLNILIFRIGFVVGCLYTIAPIASYTYIHSEKEKVLSKLSDSERRAFEKAKEFNGQQFGPPEFLILLVYLISICAYFTFIFCLFELSSMFIDMADNFLHFGSSP